MSAPKQVWTLYAIKDQFGRFVSFHETGYWWTAAPECARLWSAEFRADNWLVRHPAFNDEVVIVTFEA